ncbi:MAG: hypothetical protein IJT22_06720 [Synergistaceae bacterium]|nr:hypothetical protein [Synergistaceae bacterium]
MAACTFLDKGDVTPEMLSKLNFEFSEIYNSAENIEAASLAVKKANNRAFTMIPFCHTVEAKALGGDIFPGDDTAGPRTRAYIYKDMSELKIFSFNDFKDLQNLAQACKDLKAKGEKVAWMITGPISIISSLLPIEQIFKTWRKEPDKMLEALNNLQAALLDSVKLICESGCDLISYADPAGNLDILGPRNAAFISKNFTAPFLKEAIEICKKTGTILSVCPLAAEALQKSNLFDDEHRAERIERDRGDGIVCGCVKIMPNFNATPRPLI